jgi:ribosomal protein S18 acetylase RimI-like enzyme
MASPPSAAILVRLSPADSGEILTLQRAAYVSEAQAHGDLELPPLVQSLEELAAELADPQVLALGLREGARLLAAVRIRLDGDSADLGRLTVVPDRQGQGLGSRLLRHAEEQVSARVHRLRLFTGEHSLANQRLYQRHGYLEDARTAAGHYQLVHMTKVLPRGHVSGPYGDLTRSTGSP